MSIAASPVPPDVSRRRRRQRLLRGAAGALVGLILLVFAARFLLVRQMRLPRLTLTQDGSVMAVAVTPDGRVVFSGNDPTEDALRTTRNKPADVFVWNAASGWLIRRLPGLYWRSSGVSTSPDGSHVLGCGNVHPNVADGSTSRLIVWDWRSHQKQWSIPGDLPVSFFPDGRFVGCENGVYNAATGRLICRTSNNIPEDGQSAFTPDDKLFGVIGGYNINYRTMPNRTMPSLDDDKSFYSTTRLHFWHTDTGKEAKDFPYTRVRAFSIAHDGQWLIMVSDADGMTGGTDGSVVRRVDINTGRVLWTRERRMNGSNPDPEAVLNSVAVSPNGKYVVLLSSYGHLIVLDAENGREMFRPYVFSVRGETTWAIPGGLAFSADGKVLVSRCGRQTLVWDAAVLQ